MILTFNFSYNQSTILILLPFKSQNKLTGQFTQQQVSTKPDRFRYIRLFP